MLLKIVLTAYYCQNHVAVQIYFLISLGINMSDDSRPRYYRKNLTSHGLVYLGGEEVEVSVKNLSVTGLLAELSDKSPIKTVEDLFEAIQHSTRIDFYLPEMRIMGEAEIARADIVNGHVRLALEFCHISHDVDNALYKRKAYRKELIAPGLIVFNKNKYAFTTRNVSVTGLMIHLAEKVEVANDTITIFDFKHLSLRGQIRVVWTETAEDGGTYMGLEYMHMEKTNIKGIPRFAPDAA
jgi:hypothetical protein